MTPMTTKTQIAGVSLDSYVFNAAGPKDVTLDELRTIGASGSAAIVMKSCTIEPRQGNEEPRYVDVPLGSINSMGLPNLGYKAYLDMLGTLKSEFRTKPIVASLAGMSPEDIPVLVDAFNASAVDIIELNLSCPNLKGKPQIAYDFEMTDKILSDVTKHLKKPFGIKLPPYLDPVHWDTAAAIFKKYPINFLCCINSVGNTLIIDGETEKPLIKPKGGFGGLGGDFIKPVALANVRAFSQLLGDRMSIVGVGGIKSGMDAFEFLLAGADSVQIGTQFMKEGPGCFGRIDAELAQIMKRKGYKEISSAKGQLKVL
ncbi:MAG: dihydroorotate oxidase [Candidatus Peribacteraceae bacterium]